MKILRLVLFIELSIIIVIILVWVFRSRVGNVLPSLAPVTKENTQGEPQTNYSLTLPANYSISIFASDLSGPRDLEFAPDGTLLVSVPSKGLVYALIDKNNDGKADENKAVFSALDKPHGLAFHGDKLYVATETKIVRLDWDKSAKTLIPEKSILTLPKGGRHDTRTIAFIDTKMFVSIGSTCDVCFEKNSWNGSIIVADEEGGNARIFAKGLRNSVFIKASPQTNELWGTEMGRDFLGDDLPPDEINILRDGKDYGWPVCYGERIYDSKFDQKNPLYCERTEPPVYEIQAHSAPLGLLFVNSKELPEDWQGDLLVSYHGSWNRSTPVGYKIVHLKLDGDKVVGEEDFISGFLRGNRTLGRPVDLEFGPDGSLYISDDKAGVIYRVWKS